MLAGVVAVGLNGKLAGVLTGGLAELLAGVLSWGPIGVVTGVLARVLAGGLTGVLAGGLPGVLAELAIVASGCAATATAVLDTGGPLPAARPAAGTVASPVWTVAVTSAAGVGTQIA